VFRITVCTVLSALLISCGGGSGSESVPASTVEQEVQPPTNTDTPLNDNNQLPSSVSSNFGFTVSDAVRAKNTERWNNYIQLQVETALAPLNNTQDLLDAEIPVSYDECGVVNAFYNPFARTITLCDELVETLLVFWNGRADRTVQTLNFILYHEIGHALADILTLPITGNEESAADSFATVISGEPDRASGSVIGGLFLAADNSSFGDEHTNGEDRSGDIICWAIGSDATLLSNPSLASITQPFIDARRDCVAEYERQNRSVLFTVPALNSLQESPITNPDIIALNDPNPPKTNSTFVASGTLIPSLHTSGENEFWICEAQNRTTLVIYGFTEFEGIFNQFGLGLPALSFSVRETAVNTLTLNYTTIQFTETLSDIQVTSGNTFTATSDVEGELVCERGEI
jgi:hypothetical protein